MKTTGEIQQFIFEKAGLKTGVRKLSGSMKGYFSIRVLFQNGAYRDIPFELAQELKRLLPSNPPTYPTFCSITSIDIHESTGVTNEKIAMRADRKPKEPAQMSIKGWGSANSQMRLDKAARRNAKRLRAGNTARYY